MIKAKINSIVILGMYFIVSRITKLKSNKNTKTQHNQIIKNWKKFIHNVHLTTKLMQCYSFSINMRMVVRPKMLGDIFALTPINEEEIVVKTITEMSKNSVIIDAGAHIGKYTLLASKKASQVIAIELENQNHEILLKNLKLNEIKNVQLINAALASNESYDLQIGEDSSTHHIIKSTGKNKMNIVSLDEVLNYSKKEKIDLLKMDIEGMELEVLKKSKEIKRIIHAIIEIHNDNELNIIKNIFEQNNFTTHKNNKFLIAKNNKMEKNERR